MIALGASSASAAPPQITLTTFSHVGTESVTLEADVNPGELETTYHFEYGPADCATNPCTSTSEGTIAAETEPEGVAAPIKGLSPATTYHFRVVAKNGVTANGPDTTFTTYPPGPIFGPCPNDAFRTEPPQPSAALPDCRAYEQASPVIKEGLDARARVAFAKASLNGDRVSFSPAGGIPGGEGSQELPVYLSSRSGGNWSTQGLLPPASIGEEAFVLGWTPDFSEVFDFARKFNGGGGSFLMRSIASGSLSTILDYGEGLEREPPSYAGASADGSKVLFESTAKLAAAPIALKGKPNLYLWDRDTDQISLAGVLNDETAPAAGTFAGSYDWIGGFLNQGGAGADYTTQDEHAISADGKSVYFTAAGSGKLYLRTNPTEEQSPLNAKEECEDPTTLACTVQISTSRKTNGKPNKTDSGGPQPAAFVEATADGSTALFTSTEKLTNDANTGPELLPPTIARANVIDGSAKEAELITSRARGIAVDGNFLYWANPNLGTIERAKLDGKEVKEAFITETATKVGETTLPGKPQYVAVDGEHVYWTNAADGLKGHGTIGRADLNGENPKPELITGATNPQGIDAEGEFLYWGNAGKEDATRTIGRAKTDGSGATQAFIEVGDGSSELTPQGLAVNATHIYVGINGTQKGNYVFRFDIDGDPTSRKLFFDGSGIDIRGIALDAAHVYWARQAADEIGRINLALEAASAEREFIKEAAHPLGLAVDGEHIFWSANQESPPNPGNDLYRYRQATDELSDLTPLASGNGAEVMGVLGSSADGSTIYFAANGDLDGGGKAEEGDCKKGSGFQYSGQCSLYAVRESDPTKFEFIAPLDAGGGGSDAFDWLPRLAGGQQQKTARVSADGQTLLFRSQSKLTPYDNQGTPELYRYRAGEGISCVSCDPTEAAPTGIPSLGSINLSTLTPAEKSFTLSRNLSADGNRVFFETTDALVAADTNGQDGCPSVGPAQGKYRVCLDVYEWEAANTGSCPPGAPGGGCTYLLSSGKSPDASYFLDASATGDDVFLATRDPFVRQDGDQLYDVYDAHKEGGLRAQNEVPVICTTRDSCSPPPTPSSELESPGSASFNGPGDPKPQHPRKHKKAHKHKAHKHGKHKHRANKSGRASR